MKIFGLQDKGTNFVAEILAGLTAFITVAYLPMQCAQLMATGDVKQTAAYVAICLSAFAGCLIMGFGANKPFILSPSVGMTAFFSLTLMSGMKYSFAQGMALMLLGSLVFLLLSMTGIIERLIAAVPQGIRNAISAGLGIYIALLALRNAGFFSVNANGNWGLVDFSHQSVSLFTTFILFIGLVFMAMSKRFNLPSPILLGVIGSGLVYYFIGVPAKLVSIDNVSLKLTDSGSKLSVWASNSLFKVFTNGISQLFGSTHMTVKSLMTLFVLVFACALFNSLESSGVIYATARNSGMLDDGGNFPEMKKTMTLNSISSIISVCFGCPTVSAAPESNAGVAVNGKTGLTAVTAGMLFLAAVLFAPLMLLAPTVATSSALVYVGILMLSPIKDVDFGDINESIPAFVTMIVIPFTSSVIDGIALGLITHIVINLCTFKLKSIKLLELIITIIFAAAYFWL